MPECYDSFQEKSVNKSMYTDVNIMKQMFSRLGNKQQLNYTVPAVFILCLSYIHSVTNSSMAKNKKSPPQYHTTYTTKGTNYSVTIENLNNLVHSDFRECSLFILFFEWAGEGVGYIMGEEKFEVHLPLRGGGGGGVEGFFFPLTKNSTPIFFATSLKYYQTAFSYQAELPGVKSQISEFIRTRTIYIYIFQLICNCLNCNYHCNYRIFS